MASLAVFGEYGSAPSFGFLSTLGEDRGERMKTWQWVLAMGVLTWTPVLVKAGELEERIARIEARWKPSESMPALHVPGVSIAVIGPSGIEWARTYGVPPGTRFQAASISKPVTALAVMSLVQQGKLQLDEDVNARLTSWKVPANEFTAKQKVTLREILSHSAGFTVHGFPGYAAGEPIPALTQVLDGVKPANTPPIRVDREPGKMYSYSGGGFCVLQQLLVDTLHLPFAEILRTRVLEPLDMKDSSFEQPPSASMRTRCAVGHLPDGTPVPGNWHTYPEMAAAGLWTTPSDLGRFAMALGKAARGESERIINRATAAEMLTVQKDASGLGIGVNGKVFEHGGSNFGFRALLRASAKDGRGYAIMTNSDNGDALIQKIEAALVAEYGELSKQ